MGLVNACSERLSNPVAETQDGSPPIDPKWLNLYEKEYFKGRGVSHEEIKGLYDKVNNPQDWEFYSKFENAELYINKTGSPMVQGIQVFKGEFVFQNCMMAQVIKALHNSKQRTHWDTFVQFSTEISHQVKNFNPSLKIIQQTFKAPLNIGTKELYLKKLNFNLQGDEYFYFSSLNEETLTPEGEDPVFNGQMSDTLACIVFGIHKLEIQKLGEVKLTMILQVEDACKYASDTKLALLFKKKIMTWFESLTTHIIENQIQMSEKEGRGSNRDEMRQAFVNQIAQKLN